MDIDKNAPGNKSQQPVTRDTDNETGLNHTTEKGGTARPPEDGAPLEEDMSDVDAASSVSSEHPDS
ncbi:hypothetical protein [Pseudomonas fildesensis]|uniref:Uncharacterized protein n=1 Tax=Pseudomonas fildesensis TaxID=1674920 RepID=A0A0J8FRK3_9PSED|nr:hypothetical protein [Pseudomonas fildesensis]KMT52840.1 hypothetical protein ACR52_24640 [Pseudomonas fildesensis]